MSEKWKKKLTSKVTWVSFAAIVVGMIAHYNPGVGQEVDFVVGGIIAALTVFGILNNPDSREDY